MPTCAMETTVLIPQELALLTNSSRVITLVAAKEIHQGTKFRALQGTLRTDSLPSLPPLSPNDVSTYYLQLPAIPCFLTFSHV